MATATQIELQQRRHRLTAYRPRRWAIRCLALIGPLVTTFATSDGRADAQQHAVHESIQIRGSGAVIPLAERVAEIYMLDHPNAIVAVSSGGNRRGIKSLIMGTCDMAMAATDIPPDLERLALEKKVQLVGTEIFHDAVVAVVHPSNPVGDLSIHQLHEVFRGAITNWKELGGKDAPIIVVTQDPDSGTFDIFKKAVLGNNAVITPKAIVTPDDEFIEHVTEDAIAYTGEHDMKELKILSIGGIHATIRTVASGQYPIRRTLRLYQRKPVTPLGKALLDYFLAPDKGQAFVRTFGDVPVNP
jgi:phosphate transport system substrate-binding protein